MSNDKVVSPAAPALVSDPLTDLLLRCERDRSARELDRLKEAEEVE